MKPTIPRDLPVSKKFYTRLSDNIRSAIECVSWTGRTASYYETMEAINIYLIHRIEPAGDISTDSLLIFYLLRPDIDKAVERSRKARESAARRRRAKESVSGEKDNNLSDSQSHPDHAGERSRHRSGEVHVLPGHRMDKTKRLSMKCHTVNGRTFRPVAAIAGNGVTKIFHMDTDLVFASGVQRDLHQRIPVARAQGPVTRNG